MLLTRSLVAQVNWRSPLNNKLAFWCLTFPGKNYNSQNWRDICKTTLGATGGANAPYSGILGNGAWFSGNRPPGGFGSIGFDGSNDQVDFLNLSQFNALAEIGVSCWMWSQQTTADACLVCKGTTASASSVWTLWQDDVGATSGRTDTISFKVSSGASETRVEGSTGLIGTNKWIHVLATWRQTTEKIVLYINGIQDQADTIKNAVTMASQSVTVRVGRSGTGTLPHNGFIESPRIWTKYIDADTAWAIYQDAITGYKETLNFGSYRNLAAKAAAASTKKVPIYHLISGTM